MLAATLIALLAVAQPAGDDEDTAARKAEAGRHLQRGNAALNDGDPNEALDAYRAAYDAFPSPKIFFNMAEAHRELGELVEAANLYQRLMAELPPDSPLVQNAEEKLAELDHQLGRISVWTIPEGARIEIAGREAGASPVQDLRVLPGSVEVRATHETVTKTELVEVEAGASRSIELDLIEVAPPPPPLEVVEEDPITKKWWFWTVIGVGVLAVGTAAAVAATSGDGFRPMGELGTTELSDWRKL
jgi:hypothetical protein